MVKGICGKCRTEQDLTKRVTGRAKGKEVFCWWCPRCRDQIAPESVKLKNKGGGKNEISK